MNTLLQLKVSCCLLCCSFVASGSLQGTVAVHLFILLLVLQGFTKGVTMSRERWYGYIKDYDGGTLMECTIHPEVNYLNIPGMIHAQRQVRSCCRPATRVGHSVVMSG